MPAEQRYFAVQRPVGWIVRFERMPTSRCPASSTTIMSGTVRLALTDGFAPGADGSSAATSVTANERRIVRPGSVLRPTVCETW